MLVPVYRTKATFQDIIRDGWYMGFQAVQTAEEATAMGYKTSIEEVTRWWALLDDARKLGISGY
jgi:hypothetical protein